MKHNGEMRPKDSDIVLPNNSVMENLNAFRQAALCTQQKEIQEVTRALAAAPQKESLYYPQVLQSIALSPSSTTVSTALFFQGHLHAPESAWLLWGKIPRYETGLGVETGLLLARQVVRFKAKGSMRESILRNVHLQPPQHQHLHQLLWPHHSLPSQCLIERSTPPCSIDRRISDLSNVENILGICTDHIEENDASSVCEAIWQYESSVIVSTEIYGPVGIMSSYLLLRVEAIDKICAGEFMRLLWWGLVEAAY